MRPDSASTKGSERVGEERVRTGDLPCECYSRFRGEGRQGKLEKVEGGERLPRGWISFSSGGASMFLRRKTLSSYSRPSSSRSQIMRWAREFSSLCVVLD